MGIGRGVGLPDGSIVAQAYRYGDTPGRREALLVRDRPGGIGQRRTVGGA